MSQDYLDKLIEKDKAGTQIQSIPLHDTELRGITIDDPITVEGNPINFSTKNEQNAIQTVVDLEPIQDLHGYSKPWVGGAGKNLLPMTVDGIKARNSGMTWNGNSTIFNNVTFTILTDSDNNVIGIKVNGTAQTANANLHLPIPSINLSGHIINGCPSGGGTSTYYIRIEAPESTYFSDYGSGATITNNQAIVGCWIGVPVGGSANNLIFKPMLRLSTVSDSSFEPYTNICPIFPHEEIKIGGCGKNLFNSKILMNGTQYLLCEEFKVKPGTYNFIFTNNSSNMMAFWARSGYDIADDTTKFVNAGKTVQITYEVTGEGIVAFGFRHNPIDSTVQITDVKDAMFLVSTETDLTYEPYQQSNSLTLPLPEDVYGGTLNLETGELRVKKGICKVSDLSWSVQANAQYGKFKTSGLASKIYKTTTEAIAISEYYQSKSDQAAILYNDQIYTNGTGEVKIRDSRYIDDADATAWVAACGNCKIVYKLATPYTIQLTPAQLKLFKDVNNLNSSDYTTLTVTYHSNSIATLTPATDTTDGLLTAMDKHKLNTYDIADIGSDDGVTVEDNPLMITTRSDQHALSTKVSLAPIQDLHGYSKPWVGGAGKNLIGINDATYDILTLIKDSDGNTIGLKVNGTKSTPTFYNLFTVTLAAGTYILSGNLLNSSINTLSIRDVSGGTVYLNDIGSGATGNLNAGTYSLYLRIEGNVDNEIFYPMLRLSTEPNPTFEPYTNICSISGLDEIDILGRGKNFAYDVNYISQVTKYGDVVKASYRLNKGKKYIISFDTPNTNLKVYRNSPANLGFDSLSAYDFTCDGTRKSFYGVATEDTERTNWMVLARLSDTSSTGVGYISNFQIEEVKFNVTEPTTYEPYKQSNNLSLSLPETVYSGELNLESGELVVDRKIADLGNFVWLYDSSRSVMSYGQIIDTTIGSGVNANFINTAFERNDAVIASMPNNTSKITNGYFYVKTNLWTDASVFKTAMIGQKLVYELADSYKYTIHLTPSQLTLFKDINHISTNAKSISVTYREGKLAINSPATDTKDGLLSVIDKRALDRTEETIKGNPIQFETESAQVAKSTIVDLEPIQDLHGFTKPWVGGAGKNILPMTVDGIKAANTSGTWSGNAYTHNGITYTILVDSNNNIIGINANNTASANSYFALARNFVLSASTLISTSIDSNYYVECYDGTIFYSDLSGYQHTVPAGNIEYARITVKSGTALSNVKIYPMIRLSTVTDATFEPYTNICSISGYDKVDINGCGENLCPTTGFQSSFTVSANANMTQISGCHYKINGSISGAYWLAFILGSEGKIPVDLPKGTYTVTASNPKVRCYIYWDEEFTEYMSGLGSVTSANKPIKGIRFLIGDTTCNNEDIYLKLELGSQVTPYSPYIESTSLQINLGQTVYGGQLDIENGVLVVDRGYISDLSTLTWSKRATTTNKWQFYVALNTMKLVNSANDYANMKCSVYKIINANEAYNGTNGIGISSGINSNYTTLFVYDDTISDLTDFQNAMSGVQLTYELATPTTISLTPEQVKLLQGVNTITTNADNITLTYRNGSIATLNDLESLYAKLKAYIDSLHSS